MSLTCAAVVMAANAGEVADDTDVASEPLMTVSFTDGSLITCGYTKGRRAATETRHPMGKPTNVPALTTTCTHMHSNVSKYT